VGSFVIHLQPDPEGLGHSEETGQAQPSVGRDTTSARYDLADPALRYADLFGQSVLRDTHGLQKLL
jgi:hypothetical protein